MRFVYIILAIVLILALGFFSLNYWKAYYPLYLEVYDIGYHLAVSVGMDRAGGLTSTLFWQSASFPPQAHYPPFYHLCELIFLRSGLSLDFILKYLDWMLYPAALFSLWLFMSACFGSRAGFYSLVLMSLPPLFMEKAWGHPTFGLLCVLMPFFFLSLLKRRYITAMILLALSLATHMSAGIILPVLMIYAIHSRRERKSILIFLGVLVIFALPFLAAFFRRVSYYHFFQWKGVIAYLKAIVSKDGFIAFLHYQKLFYVHLGVLALLGVFVCYFRKGKFLFLPGIFIALGLINNIAAVGVDEGAFRYIQMLPMLMFPMLGGVFLDAAHGRLERLVEKMRLPAMMPGFKFFILIIFILSVNRLFYNLSQQPEYNRTPTIVFLNKPSIWLPYKLLFTMEQRARILELIKEHVAEDETLYNSAGVNLTNMLSAFSRRSFVKYLSELPKMAIAGEWPPGYRLLENMNPQFSVYVLIDEKNASRITLPKPILSYGWIKKGFILIGILLFLDLIWAGISYLRGRVFP